MYEDIPMESLLSPPIATISLAASRQTLYYSLSLFTINDVVNESASKIGGLTIHGDCVIVDDCRSWGDGLPTGLLSLIATKIGEMDYNIASSIIPMLGVNRAWRYELIQDRRFLRVIRFQLRDPWNPLVTALERHPHRELERRVVFGFKFQHSFSREERPRRSSTLKPPKILYLASTAGNVGSASVLACFYEASGSREDSAKWWAKAAKGGDIEALFQHGFYLYSVSDQPDDAAIYLSRAIKTVLAVDSLTQLPQKVPVEVRDDSSLCDLLSRACLILAYSYMDGHGVKSDNEIAVKLLKLAGCSEGQRALGWLYNTGQF